MTLTDWYQDHIAGDGDWRTAGYQLYLGVLRRGDGVIPSTHVYDRDWDVLVVLDACRSDTYTSVTGRNVETIWSVASESTGWLERTFNDVHADAVKETAYVTSNPHSAEYCAADQFAELIEVWRSGRDDEQGTYPANAVTNHAIAVAREMDPQRLVVHYMQPHFPSIPEPVGSVLPGHEDWGKEWSNPPKRIRTGEVSSERVRESYRENLRYVLEEVDALCQNIDAQTVVITADHGEAFGELCVYGHPDVPIPPLRKVPWDIRSATNNKTRTVDVDLAATRRDAETAVPSDVEDHLADLGYK